jgi:hypothetical protein
MENLTISALLDRVRETQNLKSDYQLGKRFGYAHQKIGNWRHERTMPDEKACEELARAAGLDPDVVIAQVNALRANEPASRAIWQRIAARLSVASGTVATAILSVAFSMSFVASDAYASSAGNDQRLNDRDITVYTSCIVWILVFFVLFAHSKTGIVPPVTFPWVPAR